MKKFDFCSRLTWFTSWPGFMQTTTTPTATATATTTPPTPTPTPTVNLS